MGRYSKVIEERRQKAIVDWEIEKQKPKSMQKRLWLDIYEQALRQNYWIYDPTIKRWQTPEEFKETESIQSGGDPNRYARYEIRNPREGIEAAFQQLQSLKDRMEIFMKKVLSYYQDH